MRKNQPRKFASQFPESQVLEAIHAIGTGREAYEQLRRLRNVISDKMAAIYARKKRPSRGRRRSEKELQQADWRFAGLISEREGIEQNEAYRRLIARRTAKAMGTVETPEADLPPGVVSVANWQEVLKKPAGWGWQELRKNAQKPAASPAPVQPAYEAEDEEDDYHGGTLLRPMKPMRPGGK